MVIMFLTMYPNIHKIVPKISLILQYYHTNREQVDLTIPIRPKIRIHQDIPVTFLIIKEDTRLALTVQVTVVEIAITATVIILVIPVILVLTGPMIREAGP